ncbi:MAG: hypothetical protein AMJ69_03780 [Gammaproteobacteria bacterium SG8_47]|nr:MAG: hypothetical protein AMJ69_03780 [Gammaproteobacteria bacterium SG8_47]
MTRILVTGATGFVGTHTLKALGAWHNVELIAACRDPGRLPPTFHGKARVGDLRDTGYVETLLDGVDVICHCMAWTSLWGQRDNSRRLYYEPTIALIEQARARGVRRFVNVSTTSAAPSQAADALAPGIPRSFWPHLNTVIAIEDHLRDHAAAAMTVVNLRLGIFAGEHYGLGVLPILLPRLTTHLVPWVARGSTALPIIDGRDIGRAMALAATAEALGGYESFNIVGPEVPTTREVIEFIHERYGYPKPHFSVPFPIAYAFAWLMEKLDPLVPWEPLVTRSIVHLLEDVQVSNAAARQRLGYSPRVNWRSAISAQLGEMHTRQRTSMKMYRPIT